MKIDDFRKLKLFMNMTQSSADQEILTAVRKANEIVARSNTTWDRILDRVIKVEVEIEPAAVSTGRPMDGASIAKRKAAHARRVEEAFETLEEGDPRGTFADFIASLKAQWDRTGRLTDAQYEALFRSADKRKRA